MATITVSAAGGNWNSTGTWVGGVIPTTTDDVRADATSGNLTVNVNVSVQFVNFTSWTGLLTINSTNTLTLNLAGSTSTFSAAGTYSFGGSGATQGRIVKGNTAMSFNMLGTTPIPHFQNTGTAILTAASNLYFINLYTTSTLQITGNNTNISGDFIAGTVTIGGTTIYNMVGTGTINTLAIGFANLTSTIVFNTSGTITISSAGLGFGTATGPNANTIFTHIAGTIVNPTFRPNWNNGTHTFNLISGTTWDLYGITQGISSPSINFSGNCLFDKFILSDIASASNFNYTLGGSQITTNDFAVISSVGNAGGTYYAGGRNVILSATFGGIIVNSSIQINGNPNEPNPVQTPNTIIRSGTPGTPVPITINTYNQYVSLTRFTDINCSGGNTLYGQALTLSNTTNITQYTLPPTTGGGGGSFTFVN